MIRELPSLQEILKSYSKKDLWERIQEKQAKIYEKDNQIAELEEKLKYAIIPKFKIGQIVWYVYNKFQKFPFKCVIDRVVYDSSKNCKVRYDTSNEFYIGIKEEDLFDSIEIANTRLKELQGENK